MIELFDGRIDDLDNGHENQRTVSKEVVGNSNVDIPDQFLTH